MSPLSAWRSAPAGAIAAALLSIASPGPAKAQQAPDPSTAPDMPDALDPASPLAPLPDLGVDWPSLETPDTTPAAPPGAAAPVTVDAAAERRYRVTIEGLDGAGGQALVDRFNALSTLKDRDGDPANVAQIDRRAREDEGTLLDLLRAAGYYDARVTARVETEEGAAHLIRVTFDAQPGQLYRFTDVDIAGLAAAGDKADALRTAFAIDADDVVDAAQVTAAEANLRAALGREGFPFAKVGEPDIVVDHEARTATLALDVTPNGARRYGAIRVEGDPLFSARHIGRIARFDPGDPYDSALTDDLRRAIIQTSLVSTVRVTPVEGTTPDTVDIAVAVEPAPPRTIAGELGFSTGEGIRAQASWTHRNFFPPEGAVTFRGVVGTREQALGASYRRSNFIKRDRVLTADITAAHIERDAYDARTFSLSGRLERLTNIIWQKKWTWGLGAELVASDERDTILATGEPRRRTFFIGALPTNLAYDGSNDLLDPTRGFRLSARLSPEVSLQDGAFGYLRAQIDGSAYLPVADDVVIAGRARFGSIVGATRDRIAPSRRFYAGGGGSVRGYGYQDIGPLDVNGDPIGGRSLAEFSLEARVRFGDFAVVPFVDAGNLYTSVLPRFSGMRYGAGIGARYHTSFGPIRVDLGTPINRREGDPKVAVYVSLGQAF